MKARRGSLVRRSSLASAVVAGFVALALVGASGARAATVIGQAPPSRGSVNACFVGQDLFQTAVASGTGYIAPSAGVVTAWRTESDVSDLGDQLRFRVYQPALTPGTYTPTSQSASETLAAAGILNSFETRQPIAAGDSIGVTVVADAGVTNCIYSTGVTPADTFRRLGTPTAIGSPAAYDPFDSQLLDLAAVIEADADGDGYGDETQDQCPTSAATAGPCPAPPAALPGPTGEQAAAIQKCKKKHKGKAQKKRRTKCIKKAKKLPV